MKKRIKELRERAGLTQAALADKVGVSQHHISRWESGARKPDIDSAIKLSEAFKVSLDYLIKGEERMIYKVYALSGGDEYLEVETNSLGQAKDEAITVWDRLSDYDKERQTVEIRWSETDTGYEALGIRDILLAEGIPFFIPEDAFKTYDGEELDTWSDVGENLTLFVEDGVTYFEDEMGRDLSMGELEGLLTEDADLKDWMTTTLREFSSKF